MHLNNKLLLREKTIKLVFQIPYVLNTCSHIQDSDMTQAGGDFSELQKWWITHPAQLSYASWATQDLKAK